MYVSLSIFILLFLSFACFEISFSLFFFFFFHGLILVQNKKIKRKKNTERCGERRIKKDGGEGVSAIFDFDVQHIQTLFEKYWWPLKGPLLYRVKVSLSTFSTDSASQLDVFGHDGDSLGVDCTQVGVLEKTNEVSFTGFLEGHNGRALET